MDKALLKGASDRIFADMAGAMTSALCYIGTASGLFRAMAGKGAMPLDRVIDDSGLQPRYVEEWLKGMTCAGYLEYDSDAATFRLPDEHAYFVASEGSDHFVGGLFAMAPVLLTVAPQVARAFSAGGGVPFEAYGEAGISALDLINRGQYEHRLASYWLQALPDIVTRLENGGRALDVGCGAGRACVAMAKAFAHAEVIGIDSDARSIDEARAAAADAGVASRTRFMLQSIAAVERGAGFDLVTAFDCVHDFAQPVDALRSIRTLLRSGGALFIMEPKVADRLEDNRNAMATMFYGFSVLHCMTQSLAQGGAGLGTCLGPAKMRSLVQSAGFTRFDRLDIKSQAYLFYAAYP